MTGNSDDISDFLDGPLKPKKPPRSYKILNAILLVSVLGFLVMLLLPAQRTARESGRRSQCINNLRQIALALIQYESVYKALPPAYTVDSAGKPLHSWRTLILPYLDQQSLYETIDLSKPWDDPANAKARAAEVPGYRCPSLDSVPGTTAYLAVVAPDSCLLPGKSRRLSEITDDHALTLMLIEAGPDHAVPWMAPMDADEALVMGIKRTSLLNHISGTNAAFVDGSVRFFRGDFSAAQRRAMISISGNDANVFPRD